MQKRAVGLGVSDHKLQEKLRIVSGSAAGRKLVSFRSTQTRPMMEKVRVNEACCGGFSGAVQFVGRLSVANAMLLLLPLF